MKTARIVVSHGINLRFFGEHINRTYKSHLNFDVRTHYTGIFTATIKGQKVILREGGNTKHLENDAAELHL